MGLFSRSRAQQAQQAPAGQYQQQPLQPATPQVGPVSPTAVYSAQPTPQQPQAQPPQQYLIHSAQFQPDPDGTYTTNLRDTHPSAYATLPPQLFTQQAPLPVYVLLPEHHHTLTHPQPPYSNTASLHNVTLSPPPRQAPQGLAHHAASSPGAVQPGRSTPTASAPLPSAQQQPSWLHQAAEQAAASGRPLTVDFVAHLQPTLETRPYGIAAPQPFPTADGGAAAAYATAAAGSLPPGWQPGGGPGHGHGHGQGADGVQGAGAEGEDNGSNPYGPLRLPALPDMRSLPPELQAFREQCAAGVRQAVAMITALEHQLFWERSRRTQAEEDCKVLLAAVAAERGLGEAAEGAAAAERTAARREGAGLVLAAEELPRASEAATAIQKHVRGHLARKEFEGHLRDILRGVDPALDPQGLPPAAQRHVSAVNAGPGGGGEGRRRGLRALLAGQAGEPGPGEDAVAYYRGQVDRIGQRLAGHDASAALPGGPRPGDPSPDPPPDPLHADVKQLLSGTYPASSAQVVAALVRRCRELQAALLEAAAELQEAQMAVAGLKESNARLGELSTLRSQLEAARQGSMRLAAEVAALRLAAARGPGQHGGGGVEGRPGPEQENPHVAAWYRRAYAEAEWGPGQGAGQSLDGPDAAVERWEDMRPAAPEPHLLMLRPSAPAAPAAYRDLLGLAQDAAMAASRPPPDPLWSMPVPDTAAFDYHRDTPLVGVQTAAPLLREGGPGLHAAAAAAAAYAQNSPRDVRAAYAGAANTSPRDRYGTASPRLAGMGGMGGPGAPPRPPSASASPRGGGVGGGWEAGAGPAEAGTPRGVGPAGPSFAYGRDTPLVPVYSVLPLVREEEAARRAASPAGHEAPRPGTPPPPQPYASPPQALAPQRQLPAVSPQARARGQPSPVSPAPFASPR